MAGEEPYSADTNSDTFADEETLIPSSSEALESAWVPTSSTAHHGSKSVVNFEDVCGGGDTNTAPRPYLRQIDLKEEAVEEDYGDGNFQPPGKKRRLSADQVHFLERHFEVENKLEPERKIQLARALGLQPRQIAIWFQNRRARWKTKQLERDYEVLKKQFEVLKADNDALHAQNEKLHAELLVLKGRDTNEAPSNLKKEIERSYWSNGSENSSDIKLDISRTSVMNSPVSSSQFSNKHHFTSSRPLVMAQQLHGSTRSDLQCFKIDHQNIQEESFCNMFNNGMEDQHGFWPWAEQQHFN